MSTKLKTILGFAFVVFTATLPVSGLFDTVSPQSLESRARRAYVALLQSGYSDQDAVTEVANVLGVERRQARRLLRKFRGRRNREASSLRSRYVGYIARNNRLNRANENLQWAICYPLANCDDDENVNACRARNDNTWAGPLADCLARQGGSLTERLCGTGRNQTQTHRGARVRLTADQYRRLTESRGGPSAGLTLVSNASAANYRAAMDSLGVAPCPVP